MENVIAVKRNNRYYQIYYILAALIPVYIAYTFHFSIPAILITTFVCTPIIALLVFAGWIKKGKPPGKITTDTTGLKIVLNEQKTVCILWQDISHLRTKRFVPNRSGTEFLFTKYKEGVRDVSTMTNTLNNMINRGYEASCPIYGFDLSPDEIVTQLNLKHQEWIGKNSSDQTDSLLASNCPD